MGGIISISPCKYCYLFLYLHKNIMKIQIYSLSNPITSEVGYVGMTKVNCISRYGSHLSSAYNPNSREYNSYKYMWFREVFNSTKQFPDLNLLEEVEVSSLQEAYIIEAIYIHKYSNIYSLCNIDSNYSNTPIYQHSLDGNFIKRWDSVVDIVISGTLNKKDIGNLMQCLLNQRKSVKGYLWSLYAGSNPSKVLRKIPKYEIDKFTKPVHMYSREGEYLESFNSAREAVGYNYKNISQVCLGEKPTHKNRRFSFNKVDKLPTLVKKYRDMSKLHKPLLCFDLNMNFIKEYTSKSHVQESMSCHIDSGQLSRAARGILKSYLGYIWRYK